MNLADQIRQFAERTNAKAEKLVKAVTMHLLTDMVQMCPVDTGLCKNSFYFGFQRDNSVETGTSKEGADSIARCAEFTGKNTLAGQTFYITNNQPYVLALEYGHSQKQAPSGFVRITVDRWQRYVDEIAGELK